MKSEMGCLKRCRNDNGGDECDDSDAAAVVVQQQSPEMSTKIGQTNALSSRLGDSLMVFSRKRKKLNSSTLEVSEVESGFKQVDKKNGYFPCNDSSSPRSCLSLSSAPKSLGKPDERDSRFNKCCVYVRGYSHKEFFQRKKDLFLLEDFKCGDVVWAKAGNRFPAWPAIVIDPTQQAPAIVLSSCIPAAHCVMFFGYSEHGRGRVNSILMLLSL